MSKLPKYLNPESPSKMGRKFEKKLVRQTINSGTLWFDQGDVSSDTHLIQAKLTERKSFTLNEKDLEQIYLQAVCKGKIPIFLIKFKNFTLTGRVVRDGKV